MSGPKAPAASYRMLAAVRATASALIVVHCATQAAAQGLERPAGGWATSVKPASASPARSGGKRARKTAGRAGAAKSATPARVPALDTATSPSAIAGSTAIPTPTDNSAPSAEPERATSGNAPAQVVVAGAQPIGAATPVGASAATQRDYAASAEEFCKNVSPVAAEARAAWLQRSIAELEREMAARTALLDARIAEHKEWLAKRQAFADQITGGLVQLFTRMRPDAAALQVAAMDEVMAAALLMRLEPKASSALMSEVPAAKAARLAGILADAGELKLPGRPAGGTPARDVPGKEAR